jgi:hypothetical protein
MTPPQETRVFLLLFFQRKQSALCRSAAGLLLSYEKEAKRLLSLRPYFPDWVDV